MIDPPPIFFNVREAREFLIKHGFVYTLRGREHKTGKYTARYGSYFKFEILGDVWVDFIKEVRDKEELRPYVADSGFKSVEDWLREAKGSTYLHKATLTSVKVNDFVLSNATLLKMAEVTLKTKKAERGFSLCYRDLKEIDPAGEQIGGRMSITVKNCPPGKEAGHFHTHPLGFSGPSWGDGYTIVKRSWLHDRPWLGCRGGTHDERIRCDTASRMATAGEMTELGKKGARMRARPLDVDPLLVDLTKEVASFSVHDVPELTKPPPPIPKEPWKSRFDRGEVELVSEKEDIYTIYRRYRHKPTGEEFLMAIEKPRPLPVP